MLRVSRLRKHFGGVVALDDISLTFPPTGIAAVIGPNGSGKTTLINVITGFVQVDSGRCYFQNKDLTNFASYRIANLGIHRTFQDLRLLQSCTCMENLLVARPKQRGETLLGAFFRAGVGLQEADNEKIALDLLRSVGLEGKASRPVEQLSYGEQKVISLLCCLAAEANVLLLDEPFSGIHPELAVQIQKLLEAISSEDRLIVFIEHDIGVVRQIAHHVIVMDEGRVVAEGSPGNVLDRPDILEAYLG